MKHLDKADAAKMFQQLMSSSHLYSYLEDELKDAVSYLTKASESVQIHRAQGKAVFIGEMMALMEKK